MYTLNDIKNGLNEAGYQATDDIVFATSTVVNFNRPLIIEGAPGAGKTSLAQAVSDWLGLPLIRMQFYEGLTAESLLYDYDYQKQLLTIQAISATLQDELKNKSVDEAIHATQGMDFYNKDFLIPRPLMKSIASPTRCVLLLDEVDKSSEEVEHILLEFLENYSISVPQLGTITCPEDRKPIVFITSNCFRELSEPLKRRCGYLYIEQKTEEELTDIITAKVDLDWNTISNIAKAIVKIQNNPNIEQKPSTSEAIDWAITIKETGVTPEKALLTIAKNHHDYNYIKNHKSKLMPELS